MFAVTMCRALALPFSMMMITACEVKIVVSAAVGSILMDYTVLSRTTSPLVCGACVFCTPGPPPDPC